jgi:hypothetical protein
MKWSKLRQPAFLFAFLVLAAGAAGFNATLRALKIHLEKEPIYAPGNRQLHSIPPELGDWERVGDDMVLSAEVLEELGTRNYVDRTYVRFDERDRPLSALQFHAAYYTGMIDAVPHVPERCFVGGGLEVAGGPYLVDMPIDTSRFLRNYLEDGDDFVRVPASVQPSGRDTVRVPRNLDQLKLRVTRFSSARAPDQPIFAGYFFLANGKFITHAEQVRFEAFSLKTDYAYYMKIQFTSQPGDYQTAEALAQDVGDLMSELLPSLLLCLPDWVEVEQGRYPEDNPRGRRTESTS